MDPATRAFITSAFEQEKTITFTVCESRPLKLSGAEVTSLDECVNQCKLLKPKAYACLYAM